MVTPGTFSVLLVPIKSGRDFQMMATARMLRKPQSSVKLLRKRHATERIPLRTIFAGFDSVKPMTIVGVVGNTRQWSIAKAPAPEIFMPYEQRTGARHCKIRRGARGAGESAAAEGS